MGNGHDIKIKNFIWRMAMDRLATSSRLAVKGIGVPLVCPLCNHPEEDFVHLFGRCPYTVNIVKMINRKTDGILENMNIRNRKITDILEEIKTKLTN